jgi:hypothetical protein
VEKNFTKALTYFKRAAALKNPEATVNLGHIYLHGEPGYLEANITNAYYYYVVGEQLAQLSAFHHLGILQASGIDDFLSPSCLKAKEKFDYNIYYSDISEWNQLAY